MMVVTNDLRDVLTSALPIQKWNTVRMILKWEAGDDINTETHNY